MIVDSCNNITTHAWSTDLPQLTISMHKCCFVNNVVFIIKVNPVNLKSTSGWVMCYGMTEYYVSDILEGSMLSKSTRGRNQLVYDLLQKTYADLKKAAEDSNIWEQ